MPFSAAELNAAIASVPRPVQMPAPWQISTLRAAPPLQPPAPARDVVVAQVVNDDVVIASETLTAAPVAERATGVSMQLHIGVERRRFLWWRLALSLVVRRLSR